MADWGNLPRDLLVLIAQQLTFMEDVIRFSASCKAWFQSMESLISGKDKLLLPPGSPLLMLSDDVNGKVTSSQLIKKRRSKNIKPRRFFKLSSGKTYEFKLPEASGRTCLGAGHGWLLTLGVDRKINLLHPFSRQQISLPPFKALPIMFGSDIFWPETAFETFIIDKAALSTNPMSSHDMGTSVMVIYGDKLAVSKLGDKVWTRLRIPSQSGVPNGWSVSLDDVVFYSGKYYVVDASGVVYVCDLDGDKGPLATAIAPAPSGTKDWYRFQNYLVEFSGDLLLVQRFRGGDITLEQPLPDHAVFDSKEEEEEETDESDDNSKMMPRDDYTVKFEVLKLEESSGEEGRTNYPYGWVKVSSLGNKSLFIGCNQSVSISGLKKLGGIKPNCIYFTDDYGGRPGGQDMGIFHMDSGITEPLLQPTSRHHYYPPIWTLPYIMMEHGTRRRHTERDHSQRA